MMRIKLLSGLLIIFAVNTIVKGNEFNLSSPNNEIKLRITVEDKIKWSIFQKGELVLKDCPVSLTIDEKKILGYKAQLISSEEKEIDREIFPVVSNKSAVIKDQYNQLELIFKNDFSIIFRIYDEGVAYRFKTEYKNEIIVRSEELKINFNGYYMSYFPEEESFISHYERLYKHVNVASVKANRFCSLPVLFQNDKNTNILFTEADLYDYPGMFLYGTGKNSLKANFPKYVLATKPRERAPDRSEVITKEANYIARTRGTREFPWRIFIITEEDGKLIESNLVFQLSSPLKLKNTEWIKPGKVAWDWWNANNVYGVDFISGINNNTYKYYIDFASDFGLEYIILDEGWSKTTTNITECKTEIDVKELVEYGKKKNVGIILWTLWKPLGNDLENILDTYRIWGVKGIKVDFMQRADQYMVNYYERVAKEAAKRELLVDYHGSFKPSGLRRAYPNVLSFEGLKGAEQNKWSEDITPMHNVTIPFIRMVAGPMDYTPGAMINAQKKNFKPVFERPMSQGTRIHQLAMYVIYESPLQMLADSPSNYMREPEMMMFLSEVPTVWDETKVLDAKISDYLIVARRSSDEWYIGAMTDWTARTFQIDLSFLEKGNYVAEIYSDGPNASRYAGDFKRTVKTISQSQSLFIELAPGGGWVARIYKPKNK